MPYFTYFADKDTKILILKIKNTSFHWLLKKNLQKLHFFQKKDFNLCFDNY